MKVNRKRVKMKEDGSVRGQAGRKRERRKREEKEKGASRGRIGERGI